MSRARRSRWWGLCCGLSLACATLARADVATGPGFELHDALTLMRASHPALFAAREDVRAADADVVDAKLWTNPQLAGVYTWGARNSSYDRVGYVNYGVTQFMELANAPGARKRAAQRTAGASRADLHALDVDLTLTVESAFIDLAAAQRTEALLERAFALLSSAGRIVHDRVAAGAAPRYDAARIDVTLALVQADLATAQADVLRALAELRGAVGPRADALKGEARYALEDGPPLPDVAELLRLLAVMRPDIEAARQRLSAAEAAVSVSRRNVLPGVGLSLAGGYGAAPRQVDVGVGLTVPVPVIDRGQGSIPAARARLAQARAQVDALLGPASMRVSGMREAIVVRRRALEEYEARAIASEDMLSEAQAGYVAGRFSVLELADAYASWRDAKLRAIALAANARQAEVELAREIGQPLREAPPR